MIFRGISVERRMFSNCVIWLVSRVFFHQAMLPAALTPPAAVSGTKHFFYLKDNRLIQILQKKVGKKNVPLKNYSNLKSWSQIISPAFNFVRQGILLVCGKDVVEIFQIRLQKSVKMKLWQVFILWLKKLEKIVFYVVIKWKTCLVCVVS